MYVTTYVDPKIYKTGIYWHVKDCSSVDLETEDMAKKCVDLYGHIEQRIIKRMKEAFNYSNMVEYGPQYDLADFINSRLDELYEHLPDDATGEYADWAIVSERALQILQDDGFEPEFSSIKYTEYYTYIAPLELVGFIDGVAIYYDEHDENDILIGYKMSEEQAPLIYAPSVPVGMEAALDEYGYRRGGFEFTTQHTLYGDDINIRKYVSYLKLHDEEYDEDDC